MVSCYGLYGQLLRYLRSAATVATVSMVTCYSVYGLYGLHGQFLRLIKTRLDHRGFIYEVNLIVTEFLPLFGLHEGWHNLILQSFYEGLQNFGHKQGGVVLCHSEGKHQLPEDGTSCHMSECYCKLQAWLKWHLVL